MSGVKSELRVGAICKEDYCEFVLWAPRASTVSVFFPENGEMSNMQKIHNGYWKVRLESIKNGVKYFYRINEKQDKSDPASRFQPDGVFGASAIVNDGSFKWTDQQWTGPDIEKMIIYELHVGTFTDEGTLESARTKIEELVELGINCIELMPVAQFSGERNWGYDGVFPYAVQNTYGGPSKLKELVDYCHSKGVSVFLDVVYNHFGLEGNFLSAFGPYFLSNRKTPWGSAINFDGPSSEHVRSYLIENALLWLRDFHIDALRLDAVYAIRDDSPKHFLRELSEVVKEFSESISRKSYLIAENFQNDTKMITPLKRGGFGLDAQWLEDFHHILHKILTGEKQGYYSNFDGIEDLIKVYIERFAWSSLQNQIVDPAEIPAEKFIIFSQNHDQIGNRPLGDRLITKVGRDAARLAAAMTTLSPYIPLLFMGEEYGEDRPFLFFTDFSNPTLAGNVRKGRQKELSAFEGSLKIPNPQNPDTFMKSKLEWNKRFNGQYQNTLRFYKKLISLRKSLNFSSKITKYDVFCLENREVIFIHTLNNNSKKETGFIGNLAKGERKIRFPWSGEYEKILDSSDYDSKRPDSEMPKEMGEGDAGSMPPSTALLYIRKPSD